MSDLLRDLYQEFILDHNRSPRNFGELSHSNRCAEGFNPLCGDQVKVYLQVEDGVIEDIRFTGTGCAISTAAASVMTEVLKGRSEEEAQVLFSDYHALVTGEAEADLDELDKLAAFAGVAEFPARVKCASLCWHTLKAALRNEGDFVTTE